MLARSVAPRRVAVYVSRIMSFTTASFSLRAMDSSAPHHVTRRSISTKMEGSRRNVGRVRPESTVFFACDIQVRPLADRASVRVIALGALPDSHRPLPFSHFCSAANGTSALLYVFNSYVRTIGQGEQYPLHPRHRDGAEPQGVRRHCMCVHLSFR